MSYYIARRILVLPLLLLGLATVTFAISHAVPADPLTTVLNERELGNPEAVASAKAHWGLDKSVPQQYVLYIWNVLHGDFGTSFALQEPAWEVMEPALVNSIKLAVLAFVIVVPISIDRKSTRLNSSHIQKSRMPSSA